MAVGADERLERMAVDELVHAGSRVEQVVGDRALGLRAQPSFHGAIEEADLRLVDDAVGDQPGRCDLQHVLAPSEAVELVCRRDRGAQLDELMVEERHPHLE